LTPHRRRADFPFAPSRWPFFYGWAIVVFATLGTLMSIPGQTIGVGIFNDFLIDDLDLTRVWISSAYMFGTIASAMTLPLAGRVFDRLGARTMVVFAALGLGATLAYLARCDAIAASLETALGAAAAGSIVPFAVLTVGFFFVRFFGQGVLTMISRAMLGKWFDRRRGLASVVSGIATTAGFSVAPKVLSALVDRLGWRDAWLALAVLLTVWALVGWLFYRDNPEECGLRMDGAPADDASGEVADLPDRTGDFTAGEALRTRAFWVVNAALGLFGLVMTAVTFHLTSIGEKVGIERGDVVEVYVPMAWVSVFANLASGHAADRTRVRYLVQAELVGLAVGSVGVVFFAHAWGRWLTIAGLGVAGGLFVTLSIVVWPRFFGRAALGSINGISTAVAVFGSALGPWLFALCERRSADYDAASWACAAVAVLILTATIGLKNPRRRRAAGI